MKKFLALTLTLVMALSLSACGGSGSSSAGGQSGGGSDGGQGGSGGGEQEYNISMILKTTSAEYWGYVIAGAEAYEQDHPNVHVTIKGPPSETSYDEQLNMVETDIANGAIDGYIISPLQASMIATAISGQTKPVIAVDTNIEAPEVLSFVGTGNESAAKLGAAAAVEMAKARGWETVECRVH